MTKREFDRLTKQNWGSSCMASDERCNYKERRRRQHNGSGATGATATRNDVIMRRGPGAYKDWGSKWPNLARWYRDTGREMLHDVEAPTLP